jgi:hypothetical protein
MNVSGEGACLLFAAEFGEAYKTRHMTRNTSRWLIVRVDVRESCGNGATMKFSNRIAMSLCGLLIAVGTTAGASQPNAVVMRFAIQSQTFADPKSPSTQGCPEMSTDAPPATAPLHVDPKVLDAITEELQKKLSKKMSVMLQPDPNTIPVGSLVISGCLTRADAGNAAERLVGMNLGTSYLAAHVRLLSKTRSGLVLLDEFDVQTKGGKVLPPIGPIGLAAHAASERKETLSVDAKKLADQILKRVSNTMKAQAHAFAAKTKTGDTTNSLVEDACSRDRSSPLRLAYAGEEHLMSAIRI